MKNCLVNKSKTGIKRSDTKVTEIKYSFKPFSYHPFGRKYYDLKCLLWCQVINKSSTPTRILGKPWETLTVIMQTDIFDRSFFRFPLSPSRCCCFPIFKLLLRTTYAAHPIKIIPPCNEHIRVTFVSSLFISARNTIFRTLNFRRWWKHLT
jgi:hypothetical protein